MTVDITKLLGQRYRPPVTPLELATRARRVIDDSDRILAGGFMWTFGDAVENVRSCVGGAWEKFGEATVRAAAEKMPGGGCRWCLAASLARVHRLPVPVDTQATRLLLGKPCGRCLLTLRPRDWATGNLVASARKPSRWTAVLAVEGTPTGDGRMFQSGSLTWAEPPLPLTWGHGALLEDKPNVVGKIESIRRDGDRIVGEGSFDTRSEAGREAARQVAAKLLRGVSVDTDETVTALGPSMDADAVVFSQARIRGAALTVYPAFVEAEISVAASVRRPPAFTASQVRHPTPVQPLRPTAATLEKMRRVGVRPESYFGANFTTEEDDAKLGRLIRSTYGRRAG